jgi:tetratricopeptide (TPR) repeat protein
MTVIKFAWIILFCVTMLPVIAQDARTLEYLKQEEQRKKSELLRELDSGVYLMDLGKYTLADEKFKHVLQNSKSVPSDLTFYFGKNSYHLGNFKQSIDWLNKYIQLKGTTGQYYEEATSWLRKAEAEMITERTLDAERTGEVLSKNYDIDCGPSGKVSCPVCKGDHVIIKKGAFGDEYRTCPYCNEHGVLTCDEYNKLLRGQLEKKQ